MRQRTCGFFVRVHPSPAHVQIAISTSAFVFTTNLKRDCEGLLSS